MKTSIKIISFALALLLTLMGLPSNISAASESGEILRELGILKGDLNGDLLLDQPLKRQDAVVLLSRLLGEEDTAENYPGQTSFTDITDPYYIPFIAWAQDSGLTEGIGGGLFGYDDYLTNQQLLAFLLRALGYDFYGEAYGLVPGKAFELELSPAGEEWGQTTTRQIMADRTVTLLRKGRVKYSNITLERSLAIEDTDLPDNGQLFQLLDFEIRNGLVVATFKAPEASDYNSSRSNRTTIIINNGPEINDLRVTVEKDSNKNPIVLELEKQFYDSTTGVLLASFEHPDIPDESTVEVKVNYLEGRETAAHEAAHVVQQKSSRTYEPGELLLLLEDLLGDILQNGSGTFSGSEFNDDELDQLTGMQTNPYFVANSLSGDMVSLEDGGTITGGSGNITLQDSVTEFIPENLFTIILKDGKEIDCSDCVSYEVNGNNVSVTLSNLDIEKSGRIEIINAYVNTRHNWINMPSRGTAFTESEIQSIARALISNLSRLGKPGMLTSISSYGLLTIQKEVIDFSKTALMQLHGVIVGTERTNSELDNEIIVAIPMENGEPELRTYKVFDYDNSFRSDEDAYAYFSRYLDPDDDGDGIDTLFVDPDSDGDGLDDVVFTKDKKPVEVTKRIDKSTPLLMTADGGLGDHVNLYLENGRVMFWTDGIDNDCDGTEEEKFATNTYIDTIQFSISNRAARTGRNPQTGKEIKIAANTPIVIDLADGSVTSTTIENADSFPEDVTTFPYAKIVTDKNDNALFIHIIQDAIVVYVESKELDKSSPKIMYTNTDDLTDEEIDFILSDEHNITKFVFRQEFGPVNGSSARIYNKRQFAEFIDYTTEEKAVAKTPRFKAGAELSKTAAPGNGEDNDCDLILVGDPPSMDGHVELGDIPEGTRAILVVDSFFDIFTEVSVDFRGHVTVLK